MAIIHKSIEHTTHKYIVHKWSHFIKEVKAKRNQPPKAELWIRGTIMQHFMHLPKYGTPGVTITMQVIRSNGKWKVEGKWLNYGRILDNAPEIILSALSYLAKYYHYYGKDNILIEELYKEMLSDYEYTRIDDGSNYYPPEKEA